MDLDVPEIEPADAARLHRTRLEQTLVELERLDRLIRDWLEWWDQKDRDEGRHKTRLETLKTVLFGALETLRSELKNVNVSAGRDTGELYKELRNYDQALVWLQRVWEYFKEKFDQRDDRDRLDPLLEDDRDRLGPLLEAADEVVWSCYRQVFVLAERRIPGLKQGPAPLSFIAPEYSPAAWEADELAPLKLREHPEIEGLEEFLQTLPVPVLSLPPWCISAPWWLVYIGHEVGHHIQHELDLVQPFKDGIGEIAEKKGLLPGEINRWKNWGEEIFADIFSVMMMGSWAVRAMLEVEWSLPDEMAQRRSSYPAPIVRLAIMARIADELKLGGSQALRGLPIKEISQANPLVQKDMNLVEDIVSFARKPMDTSSGNRLGKLETLCGIDGPSSILAAFQPNGAVETWAKELPGTPHVPNPTLEIARVLTSASLQARYDLAALDDSVQRRDALNKLGSNMLRVIRESAPQGFRAGTVLPENVKELGPDLARKLLRASRSQQTPDDTP